MQYAEKEGFLPVFCAFPSCCDYIIPVCKHQISPQKRKTPGAPPTSFLLYFGIIRESLFYKVLGNVEILCQLPDFTVPLPVSL